MKAVKAQTAHQAPHETIALPEEEPDDLPKSKVYHYDQKQVRENASQMMVLQTPIGSVVVPVGTNPVEAIKRLKQQNQANETRGGATRSPSPGKADPEKDKLVFKPNPVIGELEFVVVVPAGVAYRSLPDYQARLPLRGPACGAKVVPVATVVIDKVMWIKDARGWLPMVAPNGTEVLRETTATSYVFTFTVTMELAKRQWENMREAILTDIAQRVGVPREQIGVVGVKEGSIHATFEVQAQGHASQDTGAKLSDLRDVANAGSLSLSLAGAPVKAMSAWSVRTTKPKGDSNDSSFLGSSSLSGQRAGASSLLGVGVPFSPTSSKGLTPSRSRSPSPLQGRSRAMTHGSRGPVQTLQEAGSAYEPAAVSSPPPPQKRAGGGHGGFMGALPVPVPWDDARPRPKPFWRELGAVPVGSHPQYGARTKLYTDGRGSSLDTRTAWTCPSCNTNEKCDVHLALNEKGVSTLELDAEASMYGLQQARIPNHATLCSWMNHGGYTTFAMWRYHVRCRACGWEDAQSGGGTTVPEGAAG